MRDSHPPQIGAIGPPNQLDQAQVEGFTQLGQLVDRNQPTMVLDVADRGAGDPDQLAQVSLRPMPGGALTSHTVGDGGTEVGHITNNRNIPPPGGSIPSLFRKLLIYS